MSMMFMMMTTGVFRELNGVPKLIALLSSDVPEIQKNACGCLKNLAFGRENEENRVRLQFWMA